MPDFKINPGEMRTSITLQQPTISADSGGAQKPGFSNVGTNPTVLSRWINAHGTENSQNAERSIQRAQVVIRYRSDILTPNRHTDWQVLKGSEPWQIISIDPIGEKNHWIELLVERVQAAL